MTTDISSNPNSIYIITSFNPNAMVTPIYIITSISPITTTTTATTITTSSTITTTITTSTTITTTTTLPFCNNGTHYLSSNGTCLSKDSELQNLVYFLLTNTTNGTATANALTQYLQLIANSTVPSTPNNTLSITQIDKILENITNTTYSFADNSSIIVVSQINGTVDNETVIGLAYNTSNNTIVNTINSANVTGSFQSVAGIVRLEGLKATEYFNMLLIYNPNTVERMGNWSETDQIVSSIVVASVNRTIRNKVVIRLLFEVIVPPDPNTPGKYACKYFNSTISQWSSDGCLEPNYNEEFRRYECECYHLTSFALIWSQNLLDNKFEEYTSEDIASIVFLSISITCFVVVIIHGIYKCTWGANNEYEQDEARLPRNIILYIAFGVTMFLFVFYLSLGGTVYQRYKSLDMSKNPQGDPPAPGMRPMTRANTLTTASEASDDSCTANERVLMYIVYFLIIMMFCAKTSMGYYNYLHFVKMFPPPNYYLHLIIIMSISAVISGVATVLAIVFNSNPPNQITRTVKGKLCWFKSESHINDYFLTIPIVLFLALNTILLFLVIRYMFFSARRRNLPKVKNIRLKRMFIILYISCFTQGFGWLFGVVIPGVDQKAGRVLVWVFIIFNGLEGLFTVIAYIIGLHAELNKTIPSGPNPDPNYEELNAMNDPQPKEIEEIEFAIKNLKKTRPPTFQNTSTTDSILFSTTDFTNPTINTTLVSTLFSTSSITKLSTSTHTTPYTPENCNNSSLIQLPNNTCVSKESALIFVHQTLNSPNATNDDKAKALALYFVSVDVSSSSPTSNSTNNLSLTDIERIVDNLTDVTANISSSASFFVAQPINQTSGQDIVLGASVYSQRIGEIVTANNKGRIISNSSLTTAAIIDNTTLDGVTSLSVLIINDPTSFRNADNTTNKTIASSIVIVSVQPHHFIKSINISLYFRLLNGSRPSDDLDYRCSYFNTTNHTWEEHGCSPALYNHIYNRYECYCNHNTSFALIWTPKIPLTSHLDAQDIASLVVQFISITCFIIVIVHGLTTQLTSRLGSVQARLLLPLISTAATTLLFIFYIALALTVYKNTPSSTSTKRCFMSSSVLMFITYFLLIFMFCVKSSVGYFNYLRFVHLFPEPSLGRLYFLLLLSLVVSAVCTSLAVGLNSNAARSITELYRFKLCWFSRSVNYYFLTIPACLFVLVNVVMLIIVGSRIVSHARNATSRHQSYERMKQCVLVLMSSSISQGVGWVFGPLIGIDNEITVTVFGWIFVILIGLEGLWSASIYLIVRLQHLDEQKRVVAARLVKRAKRFLESEVYSREGVQSLEHSRCTPREVKHRFRDEEMEPVYLEEFYTIRFDELTDTDDALLFF
ncbi:unnamed protein product [Adineta ricciae]|uniref:G-protein coupled receptors family 2 profile 2 domain-containing protein n=1 Tax=Adineta ricciae TaxID=249248 RepID=A0A814HVJ1_ADIRI|nr:unnamed protein product [Adineta ricciae]